MRSYGKLFIGGHWVDPAGSDVIEVHSPHDRSAVGTVPHAAPQDVDRAVAAARAAFDDGPWPRTAPEERQRTVARFQELYAARAAEFAALITAENGSPITVTTGLNVRGLPEQTAAYLRAAAALEWEEKLPSGALLRREAVGVVAAIIPWNAPHQSALAKMVPALLAGCTVVLKASPETAIDALALAEVFAEAGFPEGVVSVLPAGRGTSEYLVAHPGVDKVAFTGSTAAGREIAATAGERLKRVSLELGGKSAAIVLDDADPTAVAHGLMYHSLGNNAENCQAHTRILAPRSRYEETVQAVRAMMESLVVGDPARPDTFIGPMVRAGQQHRVRSFIELGIAEGARLVTGGPEVPEGLEGGYYVTPTLFADVDNSMRIAREEIFGPVLVVIPFDDVEEAVRIANDSDYGLGGGVWSADHERAVGIARRIRTGTMLVNGAMPAFDGPFGGFKASGTGREFGAVGLDQYIEYKSIAV
ncbi:MULTISPECIES: aldehyde dehydrogenase [unclassified Streptomyces]|jgi:acyl-CoA reductase-like NAD-dependent aldehyde dehydrogenase|uniref:aldehyde dehydrogenase n=1 Tax=Streptomyces TaxID=1883 RepID=UPI001902E743|nr:MULTISPECIES: aldehyde dehydrogenase [unclassified Streptomyces]MCU4746872.1 aldehyde dehydrogenase [Streptomyces sp. G-5]QQN77569.1 aldehyde dehydrogenase [Streptomyces sp. XC 2026]